MSGSSAPPPAPPAPPAHPAPPAPPAGKEHVAGAVLAGGKSSRFGSDKAQAVLNGRRLLDLALEIVKPVCGRLMVAGTAVQPEDPDVLMLQDVLPDRGPISGIHAALSSSPLPYVLAVAVDMVALKRELLELIRDWPDPCHVAVPHVGGHYEPLCARYHVSCVEVIEANIKADRLKVFDFYDRVTVARIPESELRKVDPDLQSFRNINTPEDLAGFER